MNDLIPISDEQAKALSESAKAIGKAIDALSSVGAFAKETFGTVPQDIIGLLGGDHLRIRRAENIAKTLHKMKQRLERDGIERPDASLSLAIPIIIAAAEESREELQDIWAALLAAASNPQTNRSFRLKFIATAKLLDPLDAATLRQLSSQGGRVDKISMDSNLGKIHLVGASPDQIQISLNNLTGLGLVAEPSSISTIISPFGREFLRAIGPP